TCTVGRDGGFRPKNPRVCTRQLDGEGRGGSSESAGSVHAAAFRPPRQPAGTGEMDGSPRSPAHLTRYCQPLLGATIWTGDRRNPGRFRFTGGGADPSGTARLARCPVYGRLRVEYQETFENHRHVG